VWQATINLSILNLFSASLAHRQQNIFVGCFIVEKIGGMVRGCWILTDCLLLGKN